MTSGVVLLAAPGVSSDVVANALRAAFGDVVVVFEQRVSRWLLLRRRARRLGLVPVLGQLLFQLGAQPLLARAARHRLAELTQLHELDPSPWDGAVVHVPSVNAAVTRQVLRELAPRVVVINGTRIIGPETLTCIAAPFLNLHAGVTPQYRGVHGAYWALVDRRPDLVGCTVHLVDEGIDTGPVLAQPLISPSADDSFATYPMQQLGAGLPALLAAVDTVLRGGVLMLVSVRDHVAPSRLRSHPSLWGYAWHRMRHGVR
jgi:folate-dependent phosphoribosylglycinamide formyltransferase PurN